MFWWKSQPAKKESPTVPSSKTQSPPPANFKAEPKQAKNPSQQQQQNPPQQKPSQQQPHRSQVDALAEQQKQQQEYIRHQQQQQQQPQHQQQQHQQQQHQNHDENQQYHEEYHDQQPQEQEQPQMSLFQRWGLFKSSVQQDEGNQNHSNQFYSHSDLHSNQYEEPEYEDPIDQELKCPYCYQFFTEPRTLTCFHDFCTLCLQDMARTSEVPQQITCIVCNRITYLDFKGMFGLDRNTKLQDRCKNRKSDSHVFKSMDKLSSTPLSFGGHGKRDFKAVRLPAIPAHIVLSEQPVISTPLNFDFVSVLSQKYVNENQDGNAHNDIGDFVDIQPENHHQQDNQYHHSQDQGNKYQQNNNQYNKTPESTEEEDIDIFLSPKIAQMATQAAKSTVVKNAISEQQQQIVSGANDELSIKTERWKRELKQLSDMGFDDIELNIATLEDQNGNINNCLNILLTAEMPVARSSNPKQTQSKNPPIPQRTNQQQQQIQQQQQKQQQQQQQQQQQHQSLATAEKDNSWSFSSLLKGMIWKESSKSPGPAREPKFYYIQFKIPEEKVPEVIVSWVRGRWLAPSGFSNQITTGRVTKSFIPFWLFKATAASSYEFETYSEREARWVPIRAKSTNMYLDILVCAHTNDQEQQFFSDMSDWSTSGENYEKSFEYPPPPSMKCEKELDAMTVWNKYASSSITQKETQHCENNVKAAHGKGFRQLKVRTDYPDLQQTLVYMPVYLSSYTHNNTSYRVAVNGNNGAVSGERPYWLGPIGAGISFLGKTIFG